MYIYAQFPDNHVNKLADSEIVLRTGLLLNKINDQ
jgi:hypothetical protein